MGLFSLDRNYQQYDHLPRSFYRPHIPIFIKEVDDTATDTYNLSFGAKLDTSLTSGTYINTVTIGVVANLREVMLSNLAYMQEMTADICASSAEYETIQLTDSRDRYVYWVAKLEDGNCWMTQNLALALSTNIALNSADSDVSSSWTPGEYSDQCSHR